MDSDGAFDFRDTDSDSDGIADSLETTVDADSDGVFDFRETDSDSDGIAGRKESSERHKELGECEGVYAWNPEADRTGRQWGPVVGSAR